MKIVVCLAALSIAILLPEFVSAGPKNWIDYYIAANGHCMQQPPMASTAPLEKPIEEWKDQDLADLKSALNRCEALPEEETGVARMWTGSFYEAVVGLVHAQQARASQQAEAKEYAQERAEQEEARRQRMLGEQHQEAKARLDALRRAAEHEAADRKASEDRAKAVEEEQAAAVRLAVEAEARAKAAQAEAEARNGVAEARQRADRAEAAARNAEQRAAADRQAVDQRLADAYPPTREQHRASSDPIVFQLRERTVGCKSKAIFDETLAAIDAKDPERAADIAARAQEQGVCNYVQPGTYVATDRNPKSTCVKPPTSNELCYWIFSYLAR